MSKPLSSRKRPGGMGRVRPARAELCPWSPITRSSHGGEVLFLVFLSSTCPPAEPPPPCLVAGPRPRSAAGLTPIPHPRCLLSPAFCLLTSRFSLLTSAKRNACRVLTYGPNMAPPARPRTRGGDSAMPHRPKGETKPTARPCTPQRHYGKYADIRHLQPFTSAVHQVSAPFSRILKPRQPPSQSETASFTTPVSPADGRCVCLFGVDRAMEPRQEGRQD